MGGFGSGRTGGMPTIGGCGPLWLDVNGIMRSVHQALCLNAALYPVSSDREITTLSIALEWAPSVCVVIRLDLRTAAAIASLTYDITRLSYSTGPQDYPVCLVTTPCRFGAVRWWWVCPQTGRQVAKLYLPNGRSRFLSRGPGGYQLAYLSQREDQYKRAHRRGRRIRRKLGSNTTARSPIPPRPPRMRQAVYAGLRCQLLAVETLLDQQLEVFETRLTARLDRKMAGR